MAIAIPRVIARNIVFKIGATSYAPELNNVELSWGDAPGGIQTFSEVAPNQEAALTLSGYMSNDADSLYRLLWTSYGSEAAFTIKPEAGTDGVDLPAYTGTVIFNQLPPLTLVSNEDVAFEVTLRVKNTGLDVASKLFFGVTLDTTA
jgi:hypothetical protein